MKFVEYDYEDPNDDGMSGWWHIYNIKEEDEKILDVGAVLTLHGPRTPVMTVAIQNLCSAIDVAVNFAKQERAKKDPG